MKNSNKKWLVVAGALAVCAVLIGVIANQFRTPPVEETLPPASESQPASVVVAPDPIVIDPAEVVAEGGAVDSGPEQTIQPDVEKPEEPEKPAIDGDALTDPNQVPTYTPEQTNPQPPAAPSGGATRPGQIYVPGFGWIADEGGGGVGTPTDGDGDPNKQVGDM